MKDSKEKEHRISNLKNMISNVSNENVEDETSVELEEDIELINYLNEDTNDYENVEIDDEFIYHPDEDKDGNAINLEEAPIDEDYLIKTPSEKKLEEDEEGDDAFDEFAGDVSDSFDSIIHAKVGRTPIFAVFSAFLGALFIAIGAYIFSMRSDRIIDNVASGETNFISLIFLIFGLLMLIYGAYKILGFRNPLENMSNTIDSVEDETLKKESTEKDTTIPKSNIPLDKESYKVGEFSLKDLKNKIKKPSQPKKPAPPTQEELDKIPPAKEKSDDKKGLTAEEIEEMEYKQAVLENESIDDIFAEVEDIEDIPIISVDGEDNKKE